MPPVKISSFGDQSVAAARRQPCQRAHRLGRQPDTVRHLVGPVVVVPQRQLSVSSNRQAILVQEISPVSQSSSLLRQQRPHPSHRDSHCSEFMSSSAIVFQKGPVKSRAVRAGGINGFVRKPTFLLQILSFRPKCTKQANTRSGRGRCLGVLNAACGTVNRRERSLQDPFNQTDRRAGAAAGCSGWISGSIRRCGRRPPALESVGRRSTFSSGVFAYAATRRPAFEVLGEGLTLGTAGAVLMLALALPAFEETHGSWRQQDDFAVTFLDVTATKSGIAASSTRIRCRSRNCPTT